jgi:hypothetical protein
MIRRIFLQVPLGPGNLFRNADWLLLTRGESLLANQGSPMNQGSEADDSLAFIILHTVL